MPIIFTPKFAAFCSLSERFNDFGDDVFWICDYSEGSTIGFTNEVFPTIDDEFLFVLVVSVIAIVVIAISFFECFVEKLLEEADSFSDLSGSFFVGEPCVTNILSELAIGSFKMFFFVSAFVVAFPPFPRDTCRSLLMYMASRVCHVRSFYI